MPEVHATSGSDAVLPLKGRTVVVTRAADQAAGLAGPLSASGAEVLLMPVIEIVPPSSWAAADRAIDDLDHYDWIILTSVNGVDAFEQRLRLSGLRLSDLATKRVAAVGSATAACLRERGIEPALVPGTFRAEGIVAALAEVGAAAGPRVLIARAEEAREVLPDDLRALGFEVHVAPVYDIAAAPVPHDVFARFMSGDVDAVTFASGGTARRFAEALERAGMSAADVLAAPAVASIGPVTTEALREMGITVDIEAAEATSESLVQGIAAYFSAAGR